jgi:hypothetical protein
MRGLRGVTVLLGLSRLTDNGGKSLKSPRQDRFYSKFFGHRRFVGTVMLSVSEKTGHKTGFRNQVGKDPLCTAAK